MAYASRSRGGGSRGGGRRRGGGGRSRGGGNRGGGSRGRRRAPPRGGGSNATAMGVAVILLIGVVAVIVLVSGGKKKRKPEFVSEEITADTKIAKKEKSEKKPDRPPPPDISPEIIEAAKGLVTEMKEDQEAGDRLYDEAMTAKQSGNLEVWKEKLNEAKDHYLNIRDKWNDRVIAEIEGELPMGCPWDSEEVANYHLGSEGSKISRAIDRLAFIKKQLGVSR